MSTATHQHQTLNSMWSVWWTIQGVNKNASTERILKRQDCDPPWCWLNGKHINKSLPGIWIHKNKKQSSNKKRKVENTLRRRMDDSCESDLVTSFYFWYEEMYRCFQEEEGTSTLLDCAAQWNRIRGSSESRAGERLGSLNPIRELD